MPPPAEKLLPVPENASGKQQVVHTPTAANSNGADSIRHPCASIVVTTSPARVLLIAACRQRSSDFRLFPRRLVRAIPVCAGWPPSLVSASSDDQDLPSQDDTRSASLWRQAGMAGTQLPIGRLRHARPSLPVQSRRLRHGGLPCLQRRIPSSRGLSTSPA